MATRGIRNNNPGNIEYGPFAQSYGATGSDGRFAIFPTAESGIAAITGLQTRYENKGYDTVRERINRWAPPSENDTGAYVNVVAKAMGIDPDQPFSINDPKYGPAFAAAVIKHENGSQPYTGDQIAAGVANGVVNANKNTSQLPASTDYGRSLGTVIQPNMGYQAPTVPDWYSPTSDAAGVSWAVPNGPTPSYAIRPEGQNLETFRPNDMWFDNAPNLDATFESALANQPTQAAPVADAPYTASDYARDYGRAEQADQRMSQDYLNQETADRFSDTNFKPTPIGGLTSDALKTYATAGSMPAVSASDKARAYGSAQAALTPSAIQAAYARSQAQTAPAVSASDMARSYGANAARIAPYTAPNTTGITAQAIQDAYARSQAPVVSASDKARAYGAANTTPTSAEIGSRVDSATASQNSALQAALANYASHPASYTAPAASAPTISASDRARAYGASQGTSGAPSSTPAYSPTSSSGSSQSYGSVYSGSTPSSSSGATFSSPSSTSSYSAPGVSAQAGSGRYGAGTSLPSTSSSYSPDFSDNNPAWGVSAPAVTPTPAQQYQTVYETRYVPSTVFDTYGVAKNIVSDVGDLASQAYAALPSQDQVTAYLKNAIDQTAAAKKAVAAPKQVAKTVMVPKRVAVRVPVKPKVTYATPTIAAPRMVNGLNNIGTGLAAIQKIQSGTAAPNSVAYAGNNAAGYQTQWSNTGNAGTPVQTTHTPSGGSYSTSTQYAPSPMTMVTYNSGNSGDHYSGSSGGGYGGPIPTSGTNGYQSGTSASSSLANYQASYGNQSGGLWKDGGAVKKYR